MSKKIKTGITYAILACYADKGMKSKGSKSLMEFNKQKLLDYQILQITRGHKSNIPYEIIVITNFDTQKIEKYFQNKIKIYNLDLELNPIIKACKESCYENILFIDYGCIFHQKIIEQMPQSEFIMTIIGNKTDLDIGIIYDQKTRIIKHLFFDLPNKFANIFYLKKEMIKELLFDKNLHRQNLMYFEILNHLINKGYQLYNYIVSSQNLFIYFNNMGQKNGISKFIKNNQ